MNNIFVISMKKNIGKRTLLRDFLEKTNSKIWDGVDPCRYSDNGILKSSPNQTVKTRAAKDAKLNLLRHFIDNESANYLILFEEDIILHKNFYEYFHNAVKFANANEFKLIYMGVSCWVKSDAFNSDFCIQKLPMYGYRYSGAYGVIIHRSIMELLINRSNDPFLHTKPFDIYSLGYIQENYPSDCYITNPQIVAPYITHSDIRDSRDQCDFWNLCHLCDSHYIMHKSMPLYVLHDGDETSIKYFKEMILMFVPYVTPHFIRVVNGDVDKIINKYMSDINVSITSVYVGWTMNIYNIFECTENTEYIISTCQLCNRERTISQSIFNILKVKKNNGPFSKITNDDLYFNENCKCDSDGVTHHK